MGTRYYDNSGSEDRMWRTMARWALIVDRIRLRALDLLVCCSCCLLSYSIWHRRPLELSSLGFERHRVVVFPSPTTCAAVTLPGSNNVSRSQFCLWRNLKSLSNFV